jgi:hypothetical protein
MLEVHTVPVWQHPNGQRTIGLNERPYYLPVVGWCNAASIHIDGAQRWFLLNP